MFFLLPFFKFSFYFLICLFIIFYLRHHIYWKCASSQLLQFSLLTIFSFFDKKNRRKITLIHLRVIQKKLLCRICCPFFKKCLHFFVLESTQVCGLIFVTTLKDYLKSHTPLCRPFGFEFSLVQQRQNPWRVKGEIHGNWMKIKQIKDVQKE